MRCDCARCMPGVFPFPCSVLRDRVGHVEARAAAAAAQLVMEYLVAEGHAEAARVFSTECGVPSGWQHSYLVAPSSGVTPPPPLPAVPESLGSIRGRAEIRSAVAIGDTAHAIELTRVLFPELLEANVELRFALVCMYA